MARLLHFKPGGVVEYFDAYGFQEKHASTCSHCQHITQYPSESVKWNYVDRCRGCMRLICLACARKECMPWEKQCEAQEREAIKKKIAMASWRCY